MRPPSCNRPKRWRHEHARPPEVRIPPWGDGAQRQGGGMNAPIDAKLLERSAALQGLGDSRLRKEDARFIQGKGNYVDDIKMPGMVHMDIVRSPVAHARIK